MGNFAVNFQQSDWNAPHDYAIAKWCTAKMLEMELQL